MKGRLTTHVLDLIKGIPAKGLKVELWYLVAENTRTFIGIVHTNSDGRVDLPLLSDHTFKAGKYELVFYVADYFRKEHGSLSTSSFLDTVPIRFNIVDSEAHYHVPLLVAPGGYSTYRGS
ncbi:hydroxyisourate hydrolase [Bacillus chungangensis]|uniref:5-hydroxyisourate hydrolase n=1 Tax=Bacillus chungangensis TaxID=587633 RepID=A0ABT9WS64_9BACI|nr:hydroxyisourate hydrolase [Bacillus chungangensis]MDQ0176069.1 5-hydroxyisourate hydrolase [Bacillus chungangensis]